MTEGLSDPKTFSRHAINPRPVFCKPSERYRKTEVEDHKHHPTLRPIRSFISCKSILGKNTRAANQARLAPEFSLLSFLGSPNHQILTTASLYNHYQHTIFYIDLEYTEPANMSRGGGTTLYVTGFGHGTRARDLAYEFERYVTNRQLLDLSSSLETFPPFIISQYLSTRDEP